MALSLSVPKPRTVDFDHPITSKEPILRLMNSFLPSGVSEVWLYSVHATR